MSLFSSRRERRLWLWTLTILVVIYSTLGSARILVDALRERNLLGLSVTVFAILLVAAIVAPWVKKRPGWSEIGVAFGVILAFGVAFLRIENPAERTHLIEYGIVAALIHSALLERARHGRHVPMPAVLAVVVTALLGLLDEGIQAALPDRVFDWVDVFFNALAGFMVIAARLALAPVERPGWRLWFLWFIAGAITWGWCMDPSAFGLASRVQLSESLPPLTVPQYTSVAAGSTLAGVVQALLLRRYIAAWIWWAPASLAAAVLAGAVYGSVGLANAEHALVAGVVLYGAIAGWLQWLVLRSELGRAGWWVPASALGWVVSVPWGAAMGPPGWALFGAITGALLVWLLRREPAPANAPPGSA